MTLLGLLEFLRQGIIASDTYERIEKELLGRLIRSDSQRLNDWEAGYNEALADARRLIARERKKISVSLRTEER